MNTVYFVMTFSHMNTMYFYHVHPVTLSCVSCPSYSPLFFPTGPPGALMSLSLPWQPLARNKLVHTSYNDLLFEA